MPQTDPRLDALDTPALMLDETRMMRNIQRLRDHLGQFDVSLRPHLKTAKSVEVAQRILTNGNGPATVSTLAEAEVFADMGVKDIIYAVGITPQKLDRVSSIRKQGCDLAVVLDTVEQAHAVTDASRRNGLGIPALIELDCDGHRSGVAPNDPGLVQIANVLNAGPGELRGVLTHAGESYEVAGKTAHAEFAERERQAAVSAAERLRREGLPCPVVSIGSTPTAHAIQSCEGLTEIRAGVYSMFDLVQAGIGVCDIDDIALSVLTTVIGHQAQKGWIITDAGWMAMSRDRGTANQAVDQGYGLVCDETGNPIPDLVMIKANQEHGVIAHRSGDTSLLPDLPLGTRLRILPNHACATAAQFSHYNVVPCAPNAPLQTWSRFNGW